MVVLAPAAADVLYRIGASDSVVGVTNNVTEFPEAVKVGTHLNPGVEKVVSLRPSLLITTSVFDPELVRRMGAEHFVYEPQTLREIIDDVRILAAKLEKEEEGEALASALEKILEGLRPPGERASALYETRSNPLSIARDNTIMRNILETAGLRYAYPQSNGVISAEYLLAHQPDFYIYQEGPMNRNPVPPRERTGWERFRSCAWKVDEFEFARPNTKVFDTVRELNAILTSENPCAAGARRYPEK